MMRLCSRYTASLLNSPVLAKTYSTGEIGREIRIHQPADTYKLMHTLDYLNISSLVFRLCAWVLQGVKALCYNAETKEIVGRGAASFGLLPTNIKGRAEQHPSSWIKRRTPYWTIFLAKKEAASTRATPFLPLHDRAVQRPPRRLLRDWTLRPVRRSEV
eukprot:780783-Pelagomonas_calceolata.AAC.5